MAAGGLLAALAGPRRTGTALDVPVDPGADEAARWLREELAKAQYREAQPTWFDRLAQAIWEWLSGLQFGAVDGPPGLGQLIVALVVAAVVIGAFLIFGRPALSRRSRVAGALFGDDDRRDAAGMRRDAERAAASGAWPAAIADMFRAVARGLAERTIVTTSPGTTAQDFASTAAAAFPAQSAGLTAAAAAFDGVRYLGQAGTEADFRALAGLEGALRAATPERVDGPFGEAPR